MSLFSIENTVWKVLIEKPKGLSNSTELDLDVLLGWGPAVFNYLSSI